MDISSPSERQEAAKPAPLDRVLPDPAAFDHWLFDLDNTLYAPSSSLFQDVDRRMGEFIADSLGLDFNDAHKLQKHYFHTYGTTLRGLMLHHQMDPEPFLDYVHDVDISVLSHDPALEAVLGKIPGPKIIFTNSTRRHTEAVLTQLGIAHHFEAVRDIITGGYVPKPDPAAYHGLVDEHSLTPGRSILFEDTMANLAPAAAMGMTTVLVTPPAEQDPAGAQTQKGAAAAGPSAHVHHRTSDLAGWLEDMLTARMAETEGK